MTCKNLLLGLERIGLVFAIITLLLIISENGFARKSSGNAFTGSESCRRCHEKFYQLWSPSRHGKAMQPYTEKFAEKSLTLPKGATKVDGHSYEAKVGPGQGYVLEKGPGGEARLAITQVLGGKNIYYFLTPMKRGRLQTLPVAYDVKKKVWFDTAASGVRHQGDRPVSWRHSGYTFNSACHACHVSQYKQNYDLSTDTYGTTWSEPGINCESCHGPAAEHIRVCAEAPPGTVPEDLRIKRGGRDFTHEQNNATCSTCHAKSIALSTSFEPGDDFWDHYDLVTMEHSDFYPDGRDLGENYTYNTWLLSPCVKAGELDCTHCHTSSGRFRQKKNPNQACAPCHRKRIDNLESHSRHKPGNNSPGCLNCHMPMTGFARMIRSDHSMLPPTPGATREFASPNACNLCHRDKSPDWADRLVRRWHGSEHQDLILHRAFLIRAARNREWSRLPEMLAYLKDPKGDEVFKTSLVRLLASCPYEEKWQVFFELAKDSPPLLRSAALSALSGLRSRRIIDLLAGAAGLGPRLVRVRAASALASSPVMMLSPGQREVVEAAARELVQAILARPDTWQAYYNLGNYRLRQGRITEAKKAYETALGLSGEEIMPMVNLALACAQKGDADCSLKYLIKAREKEPENPVVNLNLGLFWAERKNKGKAEKFLRLALLNDPKLAQAAYNLGLLLAEKSPAEGVGLCLRAYELSPNPKYAATAAFVLKGQQKAGPAALLLEKSIDKWPGYADSYLLLAGLHQEKGRPREAEKVLKKGINSGRIFGMDKKRLLYQLGRLKSGGPAD